MSVELNTLIGGEASGLEDRVDALETAGTNAQSFADDASASAAAAAASAALADSEGNATAAEAARDDAEAAQTAAEAAQAASETALVSTEAARDIALAAVAAAGNYYTDTTIAAAIATAEGELTAGDTYAATGGDVDYVSYRTFDDPSSTELFQQAKPGGALNDQSLTGTTTVEDLSVSGDFGFGSISMSAFESREWLSATADDDGFVKSGVTLEGVTKPKGIVPSAIARLRFQCCYLATYGQSLSRGQNGFPVLSSEDSATDEMFVLGMRPEFDYSELSATEWYASTVAAKEAISPKAATLGETPCRGMADAFRALLLDENGLSAGDQDFKFHLAAPGEGGINISNLLKGAGTGYYERIIAQMQALRTLKDGVETVGMEVMPFIHGERDYLDATTKEVYKARLTTLCADIAADAIAEFDQANTVQVIGTQVASHWQSTGSPEAQIAIAQAEAVDEISNFHLACPMYMLPFRGTDVHLVNWGYVWMAGYLALCFKRLIVDQATWTTVKPLSYLVQGNLCEITYDLPEIDGLENELVWDTDQVPEQTNYGFRLFDVSDVEQAITSVSISGRNRVVIEAASDITAGSYIDYARQGDSTKGLGNLRDRAGDVLRAQPLYYDFPLHNWALISVSGAIA